MNKYRNESWNSKRITTAMTITTANSDPITAPTMRPELVSLAE